MPPALATLNEKQYLCVIKIPDHIRDDWETLQFILKYRDKLRRPMAGLSFLREEASKPGGLQRSASTQILSLGVSSSCSDVVFFCIPTSTMAKQEYITRNREWLLEKAKETGVKPLDKGIFYKVIKKGNQASPTPNRGSVVTAHYTGKTINGKTFDSSRGGVAPAFRLRELIPGWIIALQQMHIGDKWEIYIPAEQGYGKLNQPGIPGGSTLIFEIELIGIA